MTDDLVAFLRARLNEDERVALDAAFGRDKWADWEVGRTGVDVFTVEPTTDPMYLVASTGTTYPGADGHDLNTARSAHIVRHGPACVLREVEAKRRMLDDLLPDLKDADDAIKDECRSASCLASDLLKLIALPYSDRPDYRQEWKL